MDPITIAAIIAAIVGTGLTIYQTVSAKKAQREQNVFENEQIANQNAFNQDAVNKQNQFNIDMWKMQQQYNSPVNQMARYKEAGLNPVLAAGGLNTASTAPSQITTPMMAGKNVNTGVTQAVMNALQGLPQTLTAAQEARYREIAYRQNQLKLEISERNADMAEELMHSKLRDYDINYAAKKLSIAQMEELFPSKKRQSELGVELKAAELAREPLIKKKLEESISQLSLSNREKQYIYDNILPLRMENLALRNKYQNLENIKSQIFNREYDARLHESLVGQQFRNSINETTSEFKKYMFNEYKATRQIRLLMEKLRLYNAAARPTVDLIDALVPF